MSLLSTLFGKNKKSIQTYEDFWNWFQTNEKRFHRIIKTGIVQESGFLDELSEKLDALREGYFFLCGMLDDDTAEIIFTADGTVKNIVFSEELLEAAPKLSNWKFTALKPELDIENVQIQMEGYTFDSENLSFYANEDPNYPDKVDISIVHNDYNDNDISTITSGTYIFLDNYLGELNSVNCIDNLNIISKEQANKELIPISKLKDYLIWRQKEFVEKYTGFRYNTENDTYSSLTAQLESGRPLIAIMNSALLEWDSKASHPWILNIDIQYDGDDNNGMPDDETYQLLNEFEEAILEDLKDHDGYLNIGRQTADNSREIYFACKDFRKPSKILYKLSKQFADKLNISYDIYKDKYWQSFERFGMN